MATARESPPTTATPPAAKAPARIIRIPAAMVLRGVSYDEYVRLRDDPKNDRLRMTYHDGTLELMSPASVHEHPCRRLGLLIAIVAEEFEIPCEGVRSTTFRRGGAAPQRGKGKEPDEAFYFANASRIVNNKGLDLDAGDPPPDLWIEVDNRSSSAGRLPLYAGLGVPEVWRFRARAGRLWFGRLAGGTTYEAIDRSLSLPMFTPQLVLDALALGEGVLESTWTRRVREWARATLAPPDGGHA